MAHSKKSLAASVFFLLALGAARQQAFAAFTYPGCPDVTEADFKATTLFSHATDPATSEPLKMGFDMDAQGNTDIYFVQRMGQLRRYNAVKKNITELGTIAVTTESSDGLDGIAMDPNFKTTHWIYLYYTVSANKVWRISRFTINNDKLDLASEKIILSIPTKGSSQHPGGGMQFDAQGNLWFGSGENSMGVSGGAPAANTNDLRGKILRIKPKPIPDGTVLTSSGVGITYDIPDGNMFPVGTDKTKPEIYVMGTRNPYSLTLDAVRHAVTWGDVGPDGYTDPTEEHDFTTKPMNGGWPYFAGLNHNLGSGGGTPDNPTNTAAGNTGLTNLPPVIPAMHDYMEACSITGPVYYYDPTTPSKVKLPPHFNGKWFIADFSKNWVEVLTLDAKGEMVIDSQFVFANLLKNNMKGVLDFEAGPDGALYFVNYAGYRTTSALTGIIKVEYTGGCTTVGTKAQAEKKQLGISIAGTTVSLANPGAHTVEVRDLSGHLLGRHSGRDAAQYRLDEIGRPGVYILHVGTEQGSLSAKIMKE